MRKPLMVVFEGPECVGKTTIVQRLADEFSCPVEKRVRNKNKFEMLSTIIDDIRKQQLRTSVGEGDSLVLFDRWQLVSDVVYEKYCYGSESILEPLYPILSDECIDINIVIIYLNVDKDVMLDRFRTRGDKLRTIEEASRVYDAYHDMFHNCLGRSLPYVEIDTTNDSMDEAYNHVLNFISRIGGEL